MNNQTAVEATATPSQRIDLPAVVVKPAEGRSVSLGGMEVVFKVSGAHTGGAFAVVEHPIEPGRLVLPHVHHREDEYSYVLEGTIGARVGDHEIIAGPGSYVMKPRGLMHTFWNAGPGPARLLEVIAPAGFETYFIELAEAGDPGRRQELAAKYAVTYSLDWVAKLSSKYNLKLLGA
ncbi:MAG TPA: cupin domain-containing protein [Chthoniobacterales bacterium]|nr:cupin domain-containing protein [Chthoniobacterales bacterium]